MNKKNSKKNSIKHYINAGYLLPALGIFFISLYLIFSLTGGDRRGEGRRNSFNKYDTGYFLFYTLFKNLGYKVNHWYDEEMPVKYGCMIYFDYYEGDKERMEIIKEWVKKGNTLILAGIHAEEDPIFSHKIKQGKAFGVTGGNTNKNYEFSFSNSLYIEAEKEDKVILSSESGALVIERRLEFGTVLLFPDNNFFINANFNNRDHALFLNRVMSPFYALDTFFYEYGTGTRRVKNPVLVLLQGDLLYVTLHLLLLGIVFLMWRSKRFGQPLHAGLYKRRSLSVHLRAMGNFYRKTGALGLVSSLSSRYMVYRLKKLLNIKKNIPQEQWAEVLAKDSGIKEEKLKQLLGDPYGLSEKTILKKRKEIYKLIEAIKGSK